MVHRHSGDTAPFIIINLRIRWRGGINFIPFLPYYQGRRREEEKDQEREDEQKDEEGEKRRSRMSIQRRRRRRRKRKGKRKEKKKGKKSPWYPQVGWSPEPVWTHLGKNKTSCPCHKLKKKSQVNQPAV
jgi:hypothetical protein